MDPDSRKFGRGPRELTGAVDLINHYKLQAHHDFFCKRSLPSSVSETHYLHNVVGDTEIRKGEGMELEQLFQNPPYVKEVTAQIRPFELETLRQAFQLRETTPVELASADKGIPTSSEKTKSESKDKERKHKKHKDKEGKKDKEHKKHKHRHKDKDREKDKDKDKDKDKERSKDKDKEKKDKSSHHDSKKHHDKKRKHESSEDVDAHKHKKSKHKSSKADDPGLIKVAS